MNLELHNDPRENMLKSQLRTGHVLDERILGAMMDIRRESFIPGPLGGAAYTDGEIPLAKGRFLPDPLTFARFLRYAAIESHETVLDVGTATGYTAAVLSHLAQKVVALEEDASLLSTARTMLAGYPNVQIVSGPLTEGASAGGPYDLILIEGAIEVLPQALQDQLREGGRLLAVEREASAHVASAGLGKLAEWRKVRGGIYRTILRDSSIALLPSFKKPHSFAF